MRNIRGKMKSKENLLGAWSFLIGVILAIGVGFFSNQLGSFSTILYALLVVSGFLVGLLNVGDRDSMTFLVASLTLVIVSGLGQNTLIYISNINPVLSSLNSILQALLVMFVPATIIVALKSVFAIAS